MNPKYSEGEVVIIQSKHYPQENGEAIVIDMSFEEKPINAATREFMSESWVYTLEGKGDWHESALRKRHEPSQMSFQYLIQSINSPVKQES